MTQGLPLIQSAQDSIHFTVHGISCLECGPKGLLSVLVSCP